MHLSTITLFFVAAMSAVATPVDSSAQNLDARANLGRRRDFPGTCTKSDNRCKYKNSNDKYVTIACPKFDNKKCTKDGNSCTYDDADRSVKCD
ncbi:antifungal [Fusarium longipes]|uniref:Antifungal n=1 Tax=Fusarium longipes TaxID=694270 RepID=A0A395RJN1_9HYPO|nr:antifungal [Fusarium longipes]